MVRPLFTYLYCFIISCLVDLGQIQDIIGITCFSEFQQKANLQQAASGTWGHGEEAKLQLQALVWDIQPSVQRTCVRRSTSPAAPACTPDVCPLAQRLVVPTMLPEKPSGTYFVLPFWIYGSKREIKMC